MPFLLVLNYIMSEFKKKIHTECLNYLDQKIIDLEKEISSTQDSANSETKSSAGDKHETSRAMAQLENERLRKQLNNLFQLKSALNEISTSQNSSNKIEVGDYIKTDKGNFYLTVGLGLIKSTSPFFCISLVSPLGGLFHQKKVGDNINLNNNKYSILEII